MTVRLRLRIHGAFCLRRPDGTEIEIRSAKQRAMLATAPEGRCTRAWLQDTLWRRAGPSHGRASLRHALSSLRQLLGPDFDRCFAVTRAEIRLRPGGLELIGVGEGPLLGGLSIVEAGYEEWRRRIEAPLGAAAAPSAETVAAAARTDIAPGRAPPDAAPLESVRPRLAVMPFAAGSRIAPGGTLGDMLADALVRTLSGSHLVDVISLMSARRVDARSRVLSHIRERLDCDVVIFGDYVTEGPTLRVQVQVVEARTGRLLAAREDSAPLSAFLAGEARLTPDMARAIGRAVTDRATELARSAPLETIESHALLLAATDLLFRVSRPEFVAARHLLDELAERRPGSATIHAWRTLWHILSATGYHGRDDLDAGTAARVMSARALELDPEDPFALTIDGMVHTMLLDRFDIAQARYDAALALNPSLALAWVMRGAQGAFTGAGAEAVAATTRARQLSPLDPYQHFYEAVSASAHLAAGDPEEALVLTERALARDPLYPSTLRARAVALQILGREEEARAAVQALLRAAPGSSARDYLTRHPACAYPTGQAWAEALRAAGLPDTP
jgi:TolB-like protein